MEAKKSAQLERKQTQEMNRRRKEQQERRVQDCLRSHLETRVQSAQVTKYVLVYSVNYESNWYLAYMWLTFCGVVNLIIVLKVRTRARWNTEASCGECRTRIETSTEQESNRKWTLVSSLRQSFGKRCRMFCRPFLKKKTVVYRKSPKNFTHSLRLVCD